MSLSEKGQLLWKKRKMIGTIMAIELGLLLFRRGTVGMRHAQLTRLHDLFNLQLIMFTVSSLVYSRVKQLLKHFGAGLKDSLKTLCVLIILLSHASWLFFYIFWPDDSLLSTLCFISLSIYVHTSFFLLVSVVARAVYTRTIFLRKLPAALASVQLHTMLALILGIMLTVAGLAVTRYGPVVKRVDIKIANMPLIFDGFSIVLLTDMHIGPTVNEERVNQIVEMTNYLKPDVVALAGDLVDGFLYNLLKRTKPLAKLKTKYGVFFVTGNHEYYHGDVDAWVKYFNSSLNITSLRNSNRKIYRNKDDYICLGGVDDLITEKLRLSQHRLDASKAITGCSGSAATILLVHNPDAVTKIEHETIKKIDLFLAGHTHGGQFYILWLFLYFKHTYFRGLYKISGANSQIYVSPGVNYWGPPVKMRNLCEITVITLRS